MPMTWQNRNLKAKEGKETKRDLFFISHSVVHYFCVLHLKIKPIKLSEGERALATQPGVGC